VIDPDPAPGRGKSLVLPGRKAAVPVERPRKRRSEEVSLLLSGHTQAIGVSAGRPRLVVVRADERLSAGEIEPVQLRFVPFRIVADPHIQSPSSNFLDRGDRLSACDRCARSLSGRVYGSLLAEVLFLRRQIAMLQERNVRPHRPTRADRLWLVLLSKCFPWRDSFAIVQPATLIRWHRELWKHFWRWKSRRKGRPAIPVALRAEIRRMAEENPAWGCRRIASELSVKLGIIVSPRTVRKYLPRRPPHPRRQRDQRWSTFIRNHARAIVACDFVVTHTALFRTVYTLVAMEIGSRRLLHINSTSHPTADWTTQQLREVFTPEREWRYLLHDRDSIFSAELDRAIERFGVTILRSPPRSPKANAYCERLIGTLRRECLDWLIPLHEDHLRLITREWARHYNLGRPHSALGNVPEPAEGLPAPKQAHRHRLPANACVASKAILGGLHHEYSLQPAA
jgi:putative transposase